MSARIIKSVQGFTLIELLVVITIVGILSVIGVSSYGIVQQTARDGRRKAELEQLAKSIELTKDGAGIYKYTTADFTAEFARGSGTVPNNDPQSFPYCIKGSTSVAVTTNPTVAWTTANCNATNTSYARVVDSFVAEGTPTVGDLANGDIKSWILCAQLERAAVSPNTPAAAATTIYCINSGQ